MSRRRDGRFAAGGQERKRMARLDGAVAVIASEATRSMGTQDALRSLDCFVAPLLAMTIPPECAMPLE
jgi:hypothetical protein